MGYYINNTKNKVLSAHNKAMDLIHDENAELLLLPPEKLPEDKGIVCVLEGFLFEAAGFCYSQHELDVFRDVNDGRTKTWLSLPLNRAKELSGFKG